MPELTVRERLQPSLLDRLTDDEPGQQQESRQRRVLSLRRLRASVVRDLEWLFNAGNLSATEDLEHYPLVASSVVNYGLPDLSGTMASDIDEHKIEREVREAILNFEPRILRKSVKVRATVSSDLANPNTLAFEITGALWAKPAPERLYLKTHVDLETGAFTIEDFVQQGSA